MSGLVGCVGCRRTRSYIRLAGGGLFLLGHLAKNPFPRIGSLGKERLPFLSTVGGCDEVWLHFLRRFLVSMRQCVPRELFRLVLQSPALPLSHIFNVESRLSFITGKIDVCLDLRAFAEPLPPLCCRCYELFFRCWGVLIASLCLML